MNKSVTLFKVLRKCRKNTDSGASGSILAGNMLFAVLGIGVAVLLGYVGYILGPSTTAFGGTESLISSLGTVTGTAVLVLSVKTLIVSMYMSSDVDILITMPLTSMQIVINRVLDTLISSYMISAVIIIPFTVGFCVGGTVSARLIIAAVLVYLLVPVFTVMAVASVVMLIMRIVKVFRSRDALALLGIIATVLFIAAYFIFKKDIGNTGVQKAIGAAVSLLEKLKYLIPIVPFLTKFIFSGGILNLLIFFGIIALTGGIFYLVSETCYLSGALNMLNAQCSSKQLTAEEIEKISRRRSPIRSVMRKDFLLSIRTPATLMTNYIFLWGLPIVAVIVVAFSGGLSFANTAKTEMQSIIESFCLSLMLVLVVLPFFGIFTQIACKSISREGADFMPMRQIPLTSRNLIKAKRNLSLAVMGISTVGFPLVCFALLVIFGKVHWLGALFGILVCVPITVTLANAGIYFDLKQPDINWSSESDLTKSNRLYGFFIIGYCVFNIALCVGAVLITEHINSMIFLAVIGTLIIAIQAVIAVIFSKLMYSKGVKVLKYLTE